MQFLRKVLFFLFGAVSWQLPPWLNVFVQAGKKGLDYARAHKKQTFVAGLLLAGGYAGMLWYDSLPKPERVEISGTAPALTPIEEKPAYDSVYINFSASAAPLDKVGKPVTAGISITPAIKGQWTWLNDRQLQFKPAEDWAVGEDYVVDFDKGLFPSHVILKEYRYRFASARFAAELLNSHFYQDPNDPAIKRIVATIKFTHPVDRASVENRIEMIMQQKQGGVFKNGKPLAFTVSYNKFDGEAYLQSEPVKIPLKDGQVKIRIKPGMKAKRGGNRLNNVLLAEVRVPGMYNYFRVSRAEPTLVRNKNNEPEQVMIVEMTAGVQAQELRKHIEVYLLPRDRPAQQGRPVRRNYRYWNVDDIGPVVLAASEKLPLSIMPAEHDYATLYSFRYHAKPGRSLYIKINKGTRSFGGYVLAKTFETVQRVPAYPRELAIMHKGAILGMRGERKLSIVARGLDAIQFEIGRVLPGQINHLVSQSTGNLQDFYFTNYSFDADNITERFTRVQQLMPLPAEKAQYTSFDFSPYLHSKAGKQKRGLFFFKVSHWRNGKYATSPSDSRLILITDLGVLVKDNADGSHDVFVQSLDSGWPVSGARVAVLGKNGVAVHQAVTDERGHAVLPKLDHFKREQQPVAYLVQKNDDVSFIPYSDSDRSINYSRFDVGGVYDAGRKNRLSSYLFSDKGIYRPGEKFHIAMITRDNRWEQSLQGIPVEVVITDARGLTVKKQKFRLDSSGFNEIDYQTSATSPTGMYQISAYLVKDKRRRSLLGNTSVRIEEFVPDRMKIRAAFSKQRVAGWVTPDELKARVSLQNLYGVPASNRRITASMQLSPAQPFFRQYRDYRFYDPLQAKKSATEILPENKTDDEGKAEFAIDLSRFAAGSYRLSLTVQGYEAEGGRSVSTQRSQLVSPLAYLVGYKADGKLDYIRKGSARSVHLLAIDAALNKVAVENLNMALYELRHVSVLTKQSDGTYKYQSVKKKTLLHEKPLSVGREGMQYTLPTDKAGEFVLVLRDNNDTELNRIGFSVIGKGDLSRPLDRNAELKIRLNKQDFNPGEEIELQIKAPYTGAGLITIERDRVYQYKWFKTDTTTSVQRIRVPAALEGNAYVNVSFIRAVDSREIFMSPLSYGVVPFSINRNKRVNKVMLKVDGIARPGEILKIRYQTAHSGKLVVFAVNEGVLQVANYKTPDPLAHFFKKRALQVDTRQILDMLLPEYAIVRELSGTGGGDAMAMKARARNLNPFQRKQKEAVVYWSGIIETDGSEGELQYTVPDHFNGQLRVMAVAVSDGAIGVAKERTLVRGHFIVSPNVPLFVAPGDEFVVSVNIANNIEGSGEDADVRVQLQSSEQLKVIGESEQMLRISEGREKSTRFRLRANAIPGGAVLSFNVSSKNKQTRYRASLSVRPAAAYMTKLSGGYVQGSTAEIPLQRKLYPHFHERKVSVSPVPLGMAHGLVSYLDNYPYLCTEQLVSRAFPAIVLRQRPEFGLADNKVEQRLQRIIHVLRERQNAEGAFGFWAANSNVSAFQSVYATHFLTEAQQRGYAIPRDLLGKALRYLHQLAKRPVNNLAEARERAYAIYVLSRNGIVSSRYLESLRKELAEEMKPEQWQQDLTGVYIAASYKLHQLDKEADSLIAKSRLGDKQITDYRYFYDSLLRDAHLLYVLSLHFKDRLPEITAAQLQKLVDPVIAGHFNTLSSSMVILALDSYANATDTASAMKVKIVEVLNNNQQQEMTVADGLFPQMDISDNTKALRVSAADKQSVFYQVIEAGFDRDMPTSEITQQIEVQREYRNAAGKVISEARLGEEVFVHLKLRSLSKRTHANLAVVDLLPGGFEVVLSEDFRQQKGWSPQYVDAREDRMLIFTEAGNTVREFVYRIKAANTGTYTVPPAYAESMYNKQVKARGLAGKITIVKP